MRTAALALVALLASSAVRAQQSQGAGVEGVVVAAGSTQPLAGVRVQLAPDRHLESGIPPSANVEGREPVWYSATTTAEGHFEFDNVVPGSYRLFALKRGYVPGEFGQRSPHGTGIPFPLAAGQKMIEVQLTVTPTGSIAGRVYDRDGPVGRVQVQALKPVYRDGRRTLIIEQSVLSNDRGEYRLFWLPPGPYYVSAKPIGEDSGMSSVRISEPSRTGGFEQASSPVIRERTLPSGEVVQDTQLPLYYPGTLEAASAARIDLRAGASAEGMDIALTDGRVRTRRLRGIVVANGQPVAAADVSAVPRSTDPSPVIPRGQSRADGTFDIPGLLPGSYVLFARSNTGMTAALAIQVTDADVAGLVMPISSGFRMSGRFEVDGGIRAGGAFDPANLRVTLRRDPDTIGMPDGGPSFSPPPSADGSFVLEGVAPGDFRLTVRALPQHAYVKSMRLGSADVLDQGLHVSGAPRDQLEISVGAAARVSGSVTNAQQEPVPNATVAIVPEVANRHRIDLYKSTQSDNSGRFSIQGLAPGSYSVLAWEDIENGAWHDPDVLRVFESQGTSIRLRDGAEENVQVRVIPNR